MKYVDTSAVLRRLFAEPGPSFPVLKGDRVITSQLLEVEAFRAVDRARLVAQLDDEETARKRKELTDLLSVIDVMPIDRAVIDRAKSGFAVNVRALDAIHVATAEVLISEVRGEHLEFWTHDARQALAALSRGLTVRGV